MAVTFVAANAANAYQAANRIAGSGVSDAAGANAGATQGANFSNALSDVMKSASDTMHAGETAATSGLTGQGDVVNMVNAVTAAELTLQTVVAVRDKVISAYQDVMRMSI
jgi:flagellar hook-basal body complex protein FliE